MKKLIQKNEDILCEIETGIKILSNQNQSFFNHSVKTIEETLDELMDELDDNIERIEDKVEKIAKDSKNKWNSHLTILKDRRNELLLKICEQIEIQKSTYRFLLNGADSKQVLYLSDLKEKTDRFREYIEDESQELREKEIAYHKKRIAELESKK